MKTSQLILLATALFGSTGSNIAATLPNDGHTALLLSFDGTLEGAGGETPSAQAGISFTNGLVAQAVSLDASGYLRYPISANLAPTQGTVEFWIRPHWDGTAGVARVFFQAGDMVDNGIQISMDEAGQLHFVMWGENPEALEQSDGTVSGAPERRLSVDGTDWKAGQWHQLAATWGGEANEMAFYLDGERRDLGSGWIISAFSTDTFVVGSDDNGATPACASFDEFRISACVRDGNEIFEAYRFGLGMIYLSSPQGIATDSRSRLIVAESEADRVGVFDGVGVRRLSLGGRGTAPGEFDLPSSVTVDAADNIYVADTMNHRIQKFGSAGRFLLAFGTEGTNAGQFNQPRGVHVDQATQRLYVADTRNQRVQRFTLDGEVDLSWGGGGIVGTTDVVQRGHAGFDHPFAVAVNPVNGLVYVADRGNCRLEVFNAVGVYQRTFLAVYRPQALAFDGSGNLYIAGEDPPRDSYPGYDGRVRRLSAGDELISAHYGGGLDDLGKWLWGVAWRADGAVLISDYENSRLVCIDAHFIPPLTGLTVDARGTEVTFRWKTAVPCPTRVRYGADADCAQEASEAALATEHCLTVHGLAPNTRCFYRVAFFDSFEGSVHWTAPDVLNTGCLPGETQFLRVKAAAMIYTDTQAGAGYASMDATTLEAARRRLARVADFYWRNSRFKLWLDLQITEVNRDVTDTSPNLNSDLTALGYGAGDDLDAVWADFRLGNLNGSWNGSLFGRHVTFARWTSQTDFVAVHEVNHCIDHIYGWSGLSQYQFNHGLWAVPNGVGRDFAINGQILRNMLPANLTATLTPFTKILTAPDEDNDGVPDSSPPGLTRPLSVTEATLGSSPHAADTDGDGLDDITEATALPAHGLNVNHPDTDGDGVLDRWDLNPAYPMRDHVLKASPQIDGTINPQEGWTVLTERWGFTNTAYVRDVNLYQHLVTTYAAWDDHYFYLALQGPPTVTTVFVDGSADNWFLGAGSYKLTLRNDVASCAVKINVGVPDLFRQIDDHGQFSEFFDTDRRFAAPYQGRPFYNQDGEGAGFDGRLVTAADLRYQRGGSENNCAWELAIPWTGKTSFRGGPGKVMALQFEVSGDCLFETDHAARIRLIETDAARFTGIGYAEGRVTLTFEAVPGVLYQVLWKDRLTDPWQLFQPVIGQGPQTTCVDDGRFTEPDPIVAAMRFYAIRR